MSSNKTRGLKKRLQRADDEQRHAIADALPYEVGFAKPPRETRFSSTNQPQRRSRGRKQPQEPIAILEEELAAPVEVVEDGKRRKLPKVRVIMRQLINRAATGDPKALMALMEILRKGGRLGPSPASFQNQAREAEDARQQLREVFDRLMQSAKANDEMKRDR
jgi:Family of unknown function (DUF5681)